MRIVYVCADRGIPLRGNKGASVHLRSLATALAKLGHQVTIACRNVDGENPSPLGIRVEELPSAEDGHRMQLLALYSEVEADVVLERYSLSSGPAHAAARSCGLPFVLEVNAPLVDEAARYRGLEDVERWKLRERQIFASADRIIAVSDAIRSHIERMAIDTGRVAVIPNGVDLASFERADGRAVRAMYGLAMATVVGFSGSLKPWHGVERLIDALASLPPSVHLLIVGDGPERFDLDERVNKAGLTDRVVFTGAVPHLAMPGHLAAMDIATAAYQTMANFYFSPLKVIEYLAAGLPIVASDQGDMRQVIGAAGILVPAGDQGALIAAIGRLSADSTLRARLAAAARPRARDRDWLRVAEQVEGVLAALQAAA